MLIIGLLVLGLSLTGPIVYAQESNISSALLLHFNGKDGSQNFIDRFHNHTVTAYGDAQIDTDQYKFGDASAFFDGNINYLSVPDSKDWNFGAGDFTIDFWVRFNENTRGDYQYFVHQYENENNTWYFIKLKEGDVYKLNFYCAVDGVPKADYIMTNALTITNNQWHHIALVRNGTKLLMFVDGVSQALTEITAVSTNSLGGIASSLYIGASHSPSHYLNGWMDELRILKGIALWTSDFTPPTEEYYISYPISYAGENLITEGKQLVTLDGSGSSTPSGNIAYQWTQISGPQVVLSDKAIVNPTFTAPAVDFDTNLEFEVVVTDIDTGEQSKADYVTISVRPILEIQVVEDEPPVTQDRPAEVSVRPIPTNKVSTRSILTNKQGEAKPVVKVIFLVILALVLFLFIYIKKWAIKSTEEK